MSGVDLSELRRGVVLFNQAEFFEAHEVLEDIWRAAPKDQKLVLQGLVQVAVGLHHHSTGNLVGAKSVLKRALRNLGHESESPGGIQLSPVRERLGRCIEALEDGAPLRDLPRYEFREC